MVLRRHSPIFVFYNGEKKMRSHKADEKNNIILSIGMIVKNEEKVLERCLKSLQPIMNSVPGEIIIADTGSTDSTVEIAKKYTENVFHFEWINDFAAARNSTLEKARGKWYMFIDADEYFDENVDEVIDFFNNQELCSKFKTLEINIRNYTNSAKTEYADAHLARFFNIENKKEVRFTGSIHECIPISQPCGCFSTILHHTGYAYNSTQQNLNKKIRNLELMRNEYNTNSKDLRLLCHLIDGTGFRAEENEKEKYISEALELAGKDTCNSYAKVVYMQAIWYYKEVDPAYALELCDEYENTFKDVYNYIVTVAVMLYKAKTLSALTKYEESAEAFKSYFKLYNDYKNKKLNADDLAFHPVEGITLQEYVKYTCLAAIVFSKMKRFTDAFELLDQFDIIELEGAELKTFLGTVREISQSSARYDRMALYLEKIMKSDDDDKKSLALFMIESTYYGIAGEEKRKQFAKQIIDTGIATDYSRLMEFVIDQNSDDYISELKAFINNITDWKDGYSEAIYLAIKNSLDISDAVDRMEASSFREKLENIAVHHDDFAGLVLDYGVPESYTSSIKRFYWITSLYEKASYRSFELNEKKRYSLYLKFVELLGEYVFNIYNPELLEDEADVDVLSNLHKFGYYMHRANAELEKGDAVAYIREMRKALESCESMREIVNFMQEQFKKMMKL